MPKVGQMSLNFTKCFIRLSLIDTHLHDIVTEKAMVLGAHQIARFVRDQKNFFTTDADFRVLGYSLETKSLVLDLKDFVTRFPEIEIWNFLNLERILVHYQGLGIIPNVFPKWTDGSIVEQLTPSFYTTDNFVFTFDMFLEAAPTVAADPATHSTHYSVTYTFERIDVEAADSGWVPQ